MVTTLSSFFHSMWVDKAELHTMRAVLTLTQRAEARGSTGKNGGPGDLIMVNFLRKSYPIYLFFSSAIPVYSVCP